MIAATSPLFKWYVHPDDPEVVHDSFGFDPHVTQAEKRKIIKRAIEIANQLAIPRLRIFSGLGKVDHPGVIFARDPLLAYALELAERYNIDLLIENEPPCRISTPGQLLELFDEQRNPRLKLWLDIANMLFIREEISEAFLQSIADKLAYVHVKDFISVGNERQYVPVGEGQIDYAHILGAIHKLQIPNLIFTVETHTKGDKIEASRKSLAALEKLVGELGDQR